MNFFPRLLSCSMYNAFYLFNTSLYLFIFCIVFVCLCGGGLFISYVNSCSFFTDFSIKIFLPKKTFTWFYFETYVCLHYIKLTVKMDADLCLMDNLILFRCFAKRSNFQSIFATTNRNFEKKIII